MTNNLLDLAAVAGLALSLACSPALAQERFGSWDANSDQAVDATEFESGVGEAGLFSTWDSDSDGSLNEDELSAALGDRDISYAAWDADGDRLVREGEFLTGILSTYDADQNGSLDEEEFATFEDAGFFQT